MEGEEGEVIILGDFNFPHLGAWEKLRYTYFAKGQRKEMKRTKDTRPRVVCSSWNSLKSLDFTRRSKRTPGKTISLIYYGPTPHVPGM